MFIVQDISLREFQPWCGAKAVFNRLTTDEINQIEEYLTETGEQFTATDINDFFWFDTDQIFELLNINEDDFWKRGE